jgi:hypothetical protein
MQIVLAGFIFNTSGISATPFTGILSQTVPGKP